MNFKLFVFLAVSQNVWGYPDGAPDRPDICSNMKPLHGAPPQSGPSPYKLTIDRMEIDQNGKVKLTIKGASDFKGFLVQVQRMGEEYAVGTLTPTDANAKSSKPLSCGNIPGSAMTHTHSGPKGAVSLEWTPPPNLKGQFQFIVTIVQDIVTFWVKLKSDRFTVN